MQVTFFGEILFNVIHFLLATAVRHEPVTAMREHMSDFAHPYVYSSFHCSDAHQICFLTST